MRKKKPLRGAPELRFRFRHTVFQGGSNIVRVPGGPEGGKFSNFEVAEVKPGEIGLTFVLLLLQ